MKWPGDFINQIVNGEALEVMKEIPTGMIDMCLCSPPYWGLRDYGVEQIFGGDPGCEHEWDLQVLPHPMDRKGATGNLGNARSLNIAQGNIERSYCYKCQAWKGQLGLEPTPELYIEHLTEIFSEVKRVLKKEGTLWLNIGDTYGGDSPVRKSGAEQFDSEKQAVLKKSAGGIRRGASWKEIGITSKCLSMIPERLAFSLIQDGWILRNKIVWYKPNSMPSSAKDRLANRWEVIYLFAKNSKAIFWVNSKTEERVNRVPAGTRGIEGKDWEWQKVGIVDGNVFNVRARDSKKPRFLEGATEEEEENYGKSKIKKVSLWQGRSYYFNLDAIREKHHPDSIERKKRGIGPDHKYADKPKYGGGGGLNKPRLNIKDKRKGLSIPGQGPQGIHRKRHSGYYGADGEYLVNPKGKNPGDHWEITTQAFKGTHYAVFPEKLCEKPIKAGCPEGGIIIDPFCGAGTVLYVAKQLRRKFIGIDIKKDYCRTSEERLAQGVL